jgi:drug/metabolite transporter (DMT)-like permease
VLLHLALFGPAAVQALTRANALLIVVMGLGPMGVAFLTWDIALNHGAPRAVGALAYLTPLLSTVLLTQVNGHTFSS